MSVSDALKGATDPKKMDRLEAELRDKGLWEEGIRVREMKFAIWGLSEKFADLREAVRTKFNIQEKDDG